MRRQRELDLDRPALRIDHRCDRQHARGKAPVGESIGHHAGHLAHLQLLDVALVHLCHQLQRAGQRQAQQRPPGLDDLAGLDPAGQHPGVGGRRQHRLGQARPCGRSGGCRQRPLRLGLCHVGALLGVGRALRACAGLLRLCDGGAALGIVEPRRAEKTLGHQLLRALQFGLRGHEHGIGLRQRGLRAGAPGASQARQARASLALVGLGLSQCGAQLVLFEAHQHVALCDALAGGHRNLQHAAGQRAAHVHA